MNPFHHYLEKLLTDRLAKRRVGVWYDPRAEFQAFVDALPISGELEKGIRQTLIGDMPVALARFDGSFFGIKAAVEPLVDEDEPVPLLIYIPGASQDRKGSVLMELEKGGSCFEWQLKRLGRFCLMERGDSDGVIDKLLASETTTYQDIVGFLTREGGEAPSLLKMIFDGTRDNAAMLAQWLCDPGSDEKVVSKNAQSELFLLLAGRLGLELPEGMSLVKAREKALRYILANELRDDLSCTPPQTISMIPEPQNKDQLALVRKTASAMRENHPDVYVDTADAIEKALSLASQAIDPSALGKVDTFAFEEKALLKWVGERILKGEYKESLSLVSERQRSFWADRTIERQAQWRACQLMANLGDRINATRKALSRAGSEPLNWVNAYCDQEGWHRVDLVQQQLEAWAAKMTVDPEAEAALEKVRQVYEELLQDMAVGFMEALDRSGWLVSGVLQQTDVYPKVVDKEKTPAAYFLVDAMRFAMAHEFVEMLPAAREMVVKPAVAAWPTITPVGMAALLPGASAGFSLADSGGKLAALIDNAALTDINARLKFLKARIPGMKEMPLEKLLQMSRKRLNDVIAGAPLVVVRSQEIDALGEMAGGLVARQVMDTMVGNVARAVRRLAECGISRFVVTADHGHLFTRKKEDAFKTDPPGGKTLEIHRRCWIGQGGSTPAGTIRLSAGQMGYNSDLEFIFPRGIGVFKTGGDLGYHHGGLTLQEMIIPVISFRMGGEKPTMEPGGIISLSEVPEKLTNRTFGIKLAMEGLFNQTPITVRPLLLSQGVIVGKAGMALDAAYQQDTGNIVLQPGKQAGVAMILEKEDCETVRVVIQDPATDGVLAQSDDIPVKLGTV